METFVNNTLFCNATGEQSQNITLDCLASDTYTLDISLGFNGTVYAESTTQFNVVSLVEVLNITSPVLTDTFAPGDK